MLKGSEINKCEITGSALYYKTSLIFLKNIMMFLKSCEDISSYLIQPIAHCKFPHSFEFVIIHFPQIF